jgi:TolB-like protein
VTPQAFDLLVYLIRNRDRVVSKDDLISAIWGGRIITDAALATRVNSARVTIGDTGEEQRLIKTLPRKGFRFVAPVREIGKRDDAAVANSTLQPPTPVVELSDKPSIAVLPFHNMSADPEQEYFADGLVDDIIIALSRSRAFFVIARNSSFSYKGKAVDIKHVGHELGVRYVLEGSVRKAGKQLRINAQLIDVATGAHLWADRFDGALGDIFDLQDKLARQVVGAIAPEVDRAEVQRASRRRIGKIDAVTAYYRGLPHIHFPTTPDNNKAASRYFEEAIALDPSFAPAYGGAAACIAWRRANNWPGDIDVKSVSCPTTDSSNSFGKGWINADKANYRWDDYPHEAHKGGHYKKADTASCSPGGLSRPDAQESVLSLRQPQGGVLFFPFRSSHGL